MSFAVGQVMQKTGGRMNPSDAREQLKEAVADES